MRATTNILIKTNKQFNFFFNILIANKNIKATQAVLTMKEGGDDTEREQKKTAPGKSRRAKPKGEADSARRPDKRQNEPRWGVGYVLCNIFPLHTLVVSAVMRMACSISEIRGFCLLRAMRLT